MVIAFSSIVHGFLALFPEELKEELERYNIDEAEVIRRALINEVKKAKAKELEKEANKIREVLSKIPAEEVTEKIREDREQVSLKNVIKEERLESFRYNTRKIITRGGN